MDTLQVLISNFSELLKKVPWILWVALLCFIPVTSFPLLARYTGGASVSPLSMVPLIILVIFWFIPYIFRGGKLPKLSYPLLGFVVAALLSCFRAPFLEIYPFKGQTLIDREIRAIITLFIGVGFYFVASCFPRSRRDIQSSLRWIYIGAGIMFVWCTVQIFRLPYSFNPQPDSLRKIHLLFSSTELFRDRVSGMAYEPSWLADQLTILFLPLWIASVLKGYSVFRFKIWRIPIEAIFLIWGMVILFFSYSRIGLVAFISSMAVLVIGLSWRIVNHWIDKRQKAHRWSKDQLRWLYFTVIILLFVLFVVLIIFLAYQTNARIQKILTIDLQTILISKRLPVVYNLINHLEYAERLMYWISAFLVFSQYPFLGIGLGNAGLLFRQTIPAFGYYLPEVLLILDPNRMGYANPKSLWLRLLAETGIVGFMTFISWLVVLVLIAFLFNRNKKGLPAVLGLATCLAVIALIFEGFSLDTFALPQLWILLGLLTSYSMIDKEDVHSREQAI